MNLNQNKWATFFKNIVVVKKIIHVHLKENVYFTFKYSA